MRFWLPGFDQIRTRLLYLVLVALLPACALVLYGNLEQQKLEKEGLRAQAMVTARLAAASQEHFLKNAKHLLQTLANLQWLVTATNRPAVEWHLQNLRILAPDYADFGLIETNGSLFCSAAETNLSPSLTNSSVFKKCLRNSGFCAASFEVDEITKTPTMRFGYRIQGTNNAVARILYGSVRLSLLSEVLTNIALHTSGSVTVVDESGNVLSRYPDSEKWMGKNIRDHDYVQRLLREKGESTYEALGLDGTERLFATTTVSDGSGPSLFVAVGIPTASLYHHANQKLARNSIVLLLVCCGALAAGWYLAQKSIIQPVNQIVSASRLLSEGVYSARTGIVGGKSELDELAHDFDAMAESLARRELDLRIASEKISKLNAELELRVVERTKQLEATNKELEAFSYSVSHDLRAPLRHMDGFAQILMTEPSVEKDERAQRYLQMITKAARQMGMLIDDLLSFSKMGRQSMVRQNVDFAAMVRDIISEFKDEQEGRAIEWNIADLPLVEGDAAMLRQVWRNLISNALKYSRERTPARIEIGWKEKPEEMVFFVRDNGAGFEMKYADKLFGVFQRLHKPEEFEGTGIGLANVRRIVSRHFGNTWAEGELDKGATIFFSLPKRAPLSKPAN